VIEGKYTHNRICPLTREEVETRAAELVRLMSERDQIESDLDEVKKEAKAKVDVLEKRIGALAGEVRTKTSYRDTIVIDRLDSEGLTIETVDVDTGEIVSMRPAAPHERQLTLAHSRQRRARRTDIDEPSE